jgi:hypothetical protein
MDSNPNGVGINASRQLLVDRHWAQNFVLRALFRNPAHNHVQKGKKSRE